jgi:hypothetical protein
LRFQRCRLYQIVRRNGAWVTKIAKINAGNTRSRPI